MSVAPRSLLVPGIALAAAGAVALGPALVAPATLARPAVDVPAIHIEDIQLAGIGRDIYDSITQFVQYTVASAQYWIGLIPGIGQPIANQLGINYFQGIQPIVESTVYALSDIVANPFNIVTVLGNYGANLFYIGYNWASLQAQFFGLSPFAPIPVPPPLASVPAPVRGGAPAASAAVRTVPRAAAAAARVARPAAAAPAAADGTEAATVTAAGTERGTAKAAAGQQRRAAAKARGADAAS